ncbi:MAG TPA: lysophospholipid acyltransferase family protein [Gemmatimonadaceae bacterium]|jgi:glycerol-3-phosphate O-acyltransferase/dihydroxyacetone phosphate acyltransferase|nr:lysophospholipid acyltransferase family protein [Gemmatimonadaceae bacterium]
MRAIAGVALRWYYRDIQVEGLARIPRQRPLLLVVNHPNALIDALLVIWLVPRRVLITAKATIFRNPIAGALLRWLGVVPLRRASDEVQQVGSPNPARNKETFRAVYDALRGNGTVLIFPEGKSHDEPSLARLKTGAARMALYAREAGDVDELAILPIGLTFERKEAPRTRVLVQIGEPILLATWRAPPNTTPADALTAEIDARLRAITLNYQTVDDATRAVRLAAVIAALFEAVPSIGVVDRRLGAEMAIARRIDDLSSKLQQADDETRRQADQLVRHLDAVERVAAKHGVLIEDVGISLEPKRALRFILREGWLLIVGGPIAIWGRVNHWLPFRAARVIAMRSIDGASDPAMRTLVAGTAFVALTYLAQGAVVAALWGAKVALAYLISLPLAADINFYLSDRLGRAVQRARAFLRFRRDPELQVRLSEELASIRQAVLAFERALGSPRPVSTL